MGISTYILYAIAFLLLVAAFIKDKQKAILAIKKGYKAFVNLMPVLIPLFLLVGIILTVITPNQIKLILGEESGILGVFGGLLIGSVAFMPPFITYPLGAELLEIGAGYAQVAALMTSLMSVGFVYVAAETKFFGKKSVLLRNSLAIIGSMAVAFVVWVVM